MTEAETSDTGPRTAEPVRRRPTVYQVAERAGVSIATVSRALRQDSPVAPETRRRVMAAARELNWRPSRAAQILAGDTHDAVAIVLPDLAGPYYAQVIAGFESEVVRQGSSVMVLATHGRAAADQMVRDLAGRIDGLVIMDQTIPDRTVEELAASGVAVILLARPAIGGLIAIRSESVGAAASLTSHLFSHGRRRLCFLGDPDRSPDIAERWSGFVQAHIAEGLPAPAEPVRCPGFEAEHGYRAALEIFRGESPPDGIVCANDEVASGVYRAAAETGHRIPDDVAVTGWDDVNLAAHLSPPLTTVRQQMRQLGATAARLLFDRIARRHIASQVLDTELMRRESCGCRQDAPPEPAGTG
ncbi:MAG TPA: LacI family DNA-binding transcriptional regulator [Micromonosporaceae bacterium]|nr:LacI family DNA-binding transcriptional regulator [Micromonosporaceae bacterium]